MNDDHLIQLVWEMQEVCGAEMLVVDWSARLSNRLWFSWSSSLSLQSGHVNGTTCWQEA